ncbi:hypothetical protein LJR016_004318 [Devosia sp. LjRoot16]|uniref:hypothetical protein n=1 Tax=Devosia sp. LjRoot16 TaxID=3342271 RepID=UPI003ECCEB6A
MSVLDRIKAQGARTGIADVKVPEWGESPDKPLVIYYRKPTLNDAAEALKAAPGNPIRQNVDVFCMIAQNADGSPMFKRIDGVDLMQAADPDVFGRLMREMGIIRTETPDDIEKN